MKTLDYEFLSNKKYKKYESDRNKYFAIYTEIIIKNQLSENYFNYLKERWGIEEIDIITVAREESFDDIINTFDENSTTTVLVANSDGYKIVKYEEMDMITYKYYILAD